MDVLDEGFNRFDGGAPGGRPDGYIDAQGRFFGGWLLGIARTTNFFGTVLLWLTRSAKRSRAHVIWNNSRFANGRLSKFELPNFQNGFQFNCHFGLRLDFGLDTLHYPLQYRPRFWLGFFMRLHVRLQRTCVPATLVTSRALKLLSWHLFSKKHQLMTYSRKHSSKVKLTRLHD